MTIPRQLGPETGPRRALPDFSRSSATVERMIGDLQGPTAAVDGPARTIRALLPARPAGDTALRAAVAVVAFGATLVPAAVGVVLWLGVEEGHAPGIGLLLVMAALGAVAVLLALLGIRFALVALGTVRSRVEVTEAGLRVVGPLRSRFVPWHEIVAVESRVVRPVHWLTAALRLRDGSRVPMAAFDRHIWQYGAPTGQDVRALRRELRRRGPDRAR